MFIRITKNVLATFGAFALITMISSAVSDYLTNRD